MDITRPIQSKEVYDVAELNADHQCILLEQKIDRIRERSAKFVKEANKLVNQLEKKLEEESKRADALELENADLKRQLEAARSVLDDRGGISELKFYIQNLEGKTRMSLQRAVVKSLHPDKHPRAVPATKRALNDVFSIIFRMF